MIDKLYVIFAIEINSYYAGIEMNQEKKGERIFYENVNLAYKFNSLHEAEKDAIEIMQERERHGYADRTLYIIEVFVSIKPKNL